MTQLSGRRRALLLSGLAATLTLTGAVFAPIALAGKGSAASATGDPIPPTTTMTVPTTTDPTMPTTTPPPTTTFPTTTPTTTTPTTTTPTTTTTVPPRCVDPGPRDGVDPGPSDDPAVPSSGGSEINDALIDVGGRILNLADANHYPGFAGVIADVGAARLRLYWRAGEPLPPEIAQIVTDPGQPVSVLRLDSPFARSQLDPIAASLIANAVLSDQMCGFLHTVKVLEEGTGLVAGVDPYDTTFNPLRAGQLLSTVAGVPVTIEIGPQNVLTGRVDDSVPWYAGGLITAPRQGQCSTGFGIANAGDGSREYMLTALHCFPVDTQVTNGDGTRVLGPVLLTRPLQDSEVIRVNQNGRANQAGGSSFFGGVNGVGAAESSARITGKARNVRGTTVACTSGASTGENCALDVVATDIREVLRWIEFGPRGRMIVREATVKEGMVDAQSTVVRRNRQLAVAVGQGDSGGPVVTDSRDRRALGIISSGDNDVSCGLFAAPRKRCFSTVRYADITVLLDSYVAVLK